MLFERIPLSAEDDEVYLESYIADPFGEIPRKALLVLPGGGYGCVCSDREGEPIALAFMPHGYNAFVLHYTVGRKKPFPAQLIEVSQAIAYIRDNAARYGIDPEELFVVGFSAGGHLAASAATLWKLPAVQAATGRPHGYNKPTGVMLVYPVISAAWRVKTFENLWCTDTPSEEQLAATSLERHVDADSAPMFLVHTADDASVNVGNTLVMAQACAEAGIPFETHIYPYGPHGMALANAVTDGGNAAWNDPAFAKWVEHAVLWAERFCK
ncbi:MAG: alpha/beta hydrolase [Ruminococcaceae bacterium]|nr:alpha/beta hydrolase [Oscillospiraceae bacterium]